MYRERTGPLVAFPDEWFHDEVRDGFYVDGLKKCAWAAQLEVLKEVEIVCQRHGLKFFADCGTLLGAVRHGGYIPWDDDLDICMFRDDYVKFQKYAPKELPEGYFVLDYHFDGYDELLLRISNTDLIRPESEWYAQYHNFPFPAGLDIFPLDFLSQDPEEEDARKNLAKIVFDCAHREDLDSQPSKETLAALGRVIELTHARIDLKKPLRPQLFDIGVGLFSLYKRHEAKEVALMPYWIDHDDHVYPMELFDQTVRLPFETTDVPAPACYDQVLTIEYGDYMKIVHGGGVHDYPFYADFERKLEQHVPGKRLPYKYYFDPADVADAEQRKEMNKSVKARAEEFVPILREAHGEIRKQLDAKAFAVASGLLADCQDGAISLGNLIEGSEGEGFITVKHLEEYCELLFHINEEIPSGEEAETRLNAQLDVILSSIQNDIKVRKEIVFLPYKASMWDSLESVWRKAAEDPDCDAYVVPIPYVDKNPDGSIRSTHFEIDQYPSDVPVTDYRGFDLAAHHPDEIYIHNPYDECNFVTSVLPQFYSKELKKVTDKLVYIPYFVLDEIDPEDERAVESMAHFVTVPGVINADVVIVQSEAMRQSYINALVTQYGEEYRPIWEQKIRGDGSPKFDRLQSVSRENVDVPEEWKKFLSREDGSPKKVILYNTSVSTLLEKKEKMIGKMRRVFAIFKENQNDVALLWRPHPLIEATIASMRPALWDEYQKLVEDYKAEAFGIYDDTADLHRAIALSDAYYGDPSLVVQLCRRAGKPVMLEDCDVE